MQTPKVIIQLWIELETFILLEIFCVLLEQKSLNNVLFILHYGHTHIHTFTLIYIYIYIYICVCVCVCVCMCVCGACVTVIVTESGHGNTSSNSQNAHTLGKVIIPPAKEK